MRIVIAIAAVIALPGRIDPQGARGAQIEVSDTRIALEDNSGQSIGNIVDFGSPSQVFNANLKFDAWVLPFLNIYALVGYVHNNSARLAHVTLRSPASAASR